MAQKQFGGLLTCDAVLDAAKKPKSCSPTGPISAAGKISLGLESVEDGMSGGENTLLTFTSTWFADVAKNNWEQLIPKLNPKRILEIGSYEGASSCYLIQKLANEHSLELHCVDPWQGYGELPNTDMNVVEKRFDTNINIARAAAKYAVDVVKHKEPSDIALSKLLASGKRNYFDFVYVDGAHYAPEVLFDAVAAFRLARPGGVIAFDDYLLTETIPANRDPILSPKPAIDAFVNLYCRKLNIINAPLYQLYVQKVSD